jgi:hypothetical protein
VRRPIKAGDGPYRAEEVTTLAEKGAEVFQIHVPPSQLGDSS